MTIKKIQKWRKVPKASERNLDDIEEIKEIGENFGTNITDTITMSYSDGHPPQNVVMEILSYKLSTNKVILLFFSGSHFNCHPSIH